MYYELLQLSRTTIGALDRIEYIMQSHIHYYSKQNKMIILYDKVSLLGNSSNGQSPTRLADMTKLFPWMIILVHTFIETLKWEVLPDQLYSLFDHYLFLWMAYGLSEKHLTLYEDTKNWRIASKNEEAFFRYSYPFRKMEKSSG